MKVSLNWLKQFTEIDLSVDELVYKIGVQLGAVEEVIELGKKYQGIIIARVVSCDKHPNADKLSVCWIDDGGTAQGVDRNEQGLIQVVCGAPNVRAGLLVAWLPPGSTVPNTFDSDPFVLSSRELRGVVSNGMLASASELAISDDHNGIVELELDVEPGMDFAEAYQLHDYIVDIENKMFTHRPDCFGLLGVAREIAGIQHKQFVSPEWYVAALDRIKPGKTKLPLTVTNDIPELVPRFMAIAMADVTVKPSPLMLQTYLSRVGLRPINNLVDITNYLMVLTGQPTHVYDADKLRALSGSKEEIRLGTRLSRPGDKIKLLNGRELELQDASTVLITSGDVPVGIGGAMGGADTEVGENTKNIVIECANFDMYSIRRTSMRYGIFTDAVTRFNKGQSQLQNDRVLEESVALVQSLAGGHVASDVFDPGALTESHQEVAVSVAFINERLGLNLVADEIVRLLLNVEFEVSHGGDQLKIRPPFWRTDIVIGEDVVEEIGRLYGLDRLPLDLPQRSIMPVQPDPKLSLKTSLRSRLASYGANEVLTYGFVHGNVMQKAGQDTDLAFKLSNALSPDLQYYRLSITPSLLDKVHGNIKLGHSEFALFEIGKVHGKSEMDDDGLPREFDRIALVVAQEEKVAKSRASGAAYFLAKKYAQSVFGVQAHNARFVAPANADLGGHKLFAQLLAPFDEKRCAVVFLGEKLAGVVGEYKTSVIRAFKLPSYTAGFELFLSPLTDPISTNYVAVSRFPKVEQDVTLRAPREMQYQLLEDFVQQNLRTPQNSHYSLLPTAIYRKQSGDAFVQTTFRLVISSYDRTLVAEEVNKLLDDVALAGSDKNITRV